MRKRRRRLRAGGWLASLAVSVGVAVLLTRAADWPLWTLALLPALTAALWHVWMHDEGGVPVLVYHSVSADAGWLPWADEISVTPDTLERHLRALTAGGCRVVRTADLVAARRNGSTLPERPVVIHLDDGYLDNWVGAFPVLKRYNAPATVFVSLDFVEPGDTPRPTVDDVAAGRCTAADLQWAGYLNWAELRALHDSGLVDVQPHGIDHGRVVTGPRVVDEVQPHNWRRLAWVQWAAMSGNKADWYHSTTPPAVPFGTPVRESAPALAAPAWSDEGPETDAQYEGRVATVLARSRTVLAESLHTEARVFCWPQNRTSRRARELAAQAGYDATTAGAGENRPAEDAAIISRVHAGDRPAGWRWPWLEGPALYIQARVFHGNYYWYLALWPIQAMRGLVTGLRALLSGRSA